MTVDTLNLCLTDFIRAGRTVHAAMSHRSKSNLQLNELLHFSSMCTEQQGCSEMSVTFVTVTPLDDQKTDQLNLYILFVEDNNFIETSGRLHPLWPQNKRLHTPRTTDYRHTRQYRWIQTELVPTLAKMLQNRIPLKSYHYRPQGWRTIGRPKKRSR